jgi:hypothetical protein
MRIGERPVCSFIDAQNSFITCQARQHDVTAGGKLRDALRDSAAISNERFRLRAMPVVGGKPETELKQLLCDWPTHVADTDESESAFC